MSLFKKNSIGLKKDLEKKLHFINSILSDDIVVSKLIISELKSHVLNRVKSISHSLNSNQFDSFKNSILLRKLLDHAVLKDIKKVSGVNSSFNKVLLELKELLNELNSLQRNSDIKEIYSEKLLELEKYIQKDSFLFKKLDSDLSSFEKVLLELINFLKSFNVDFSNSSQVKDFEDTFDEYFDEFFMVFKNILHFDSELFIFLNSLSKFVLKDLSNKSVIIDFHNTFEGKTIFLDSAFFKAIQDFDEKGTVFLDSCSLKGVNLIITPTVYREAMRGLNGHNSSLINSSSYNSVYSKLVESNRFISFHDENYAPNILKKNNPLLFNRIEKFWRKYPKRGSTFEGFIKGAEFRIIAYLLDNHLSHSSSYFIIGSDSDFLNFQKAGALRAGMYLDILNFIKSA